MSAPSLRNRAGGRGPFCGAFPAKLWTGGGVWHHQPAGVPRRPGKRSGLSGGRAPSPVLLVRRQSGDYDGRGQLMHTVTAELAKPTQAGGYRIALDLRSQAGTDGRFVPAEAEITGGAMLVRAEGVSCPAEVRMGFGGECTIICITATDWRRPRSDSAVRCPSGAVGYVSGKTALYRL